MKRISIIIFVMFAFIIFPFNIKAVSTDYISIDERTNLLEEAGLSLIDVKFNDFSNTEYPSIGMSGLIQNNNSYEIDYKIVAEFYDSSYEILGETMIEGTFDAFKEQSYSNLKSPDEVLKRGNVSDIKYYKLSIDASAPALLNSSEYYLKAYDVDIKVNEDNTYDVTEKITAYYNVDKHGIIRTIPLKNNIIRLDGTTSHNKAKVKNVSVDNKYKTYREGNNYVIKIGSKSKTVRGEHQYVIKYTYNIGKDPLKDIDELYYNIIGTEWDTTISGITFKITMPKDFDASKIGFSSGSKGSTDNKYIEYNVDGNIITGSYKATLDEGEGLTIRCELPEGYFNGKNYDYIYTIIVGITSLFGIIQALVLWRKNGRNDKVIETVEFYPPKGYNSCEVQYLLDGYSKKEGVVSLLIYLASKGYLKIEEMEEKKLLYNKKGFKITKLKDYDGDNKIEDKFLNNLFMCGSPLSLSVTREDLEGEFYTTVDSIKSDTKKELEDKVFVNNSKVEKNMKVTVILISFLIIFISMLSLYGGVYIGYLMISFIILFIILFGFYSFSNSKGNVSRWISMGVLAIVVITIHYIGMMCVEEGDLNLYTYATIMIGCISVVIILFIDSFMPKRTKYGNEVLGKIRGFKNFLITARKEELEEQIEKNPTYFYDILPFTYALGVSKKWVKKFESISIEPPNWYQGTDDFTFSTFNSFMNNTMSSASSSMTYNPSDPGGDSGGGFSGGGSGGGGGSSW